MSIQEVPQPSAEARRDFRRTLPDVLVDCAVILALTGLALLGFKSSFGGWAFLLPGAAGATVGVGLAWSAWRLRLSVLNLAAATLVTMTALAGLFALPGTAVMAVLPTADTVRGLAQGISRGWVDLVTLDPPVGDVGNLMAIPYFCGLTCTVIATTLVLRGRHLRWAVIPPALTLGAGILTGVSSPVSVLAQGAFFAAIAVGWWSLRSRTTTEVTGLASSRSSAGMQVISAVGLLTLATVGSLALGPLMPVSSSQTRLILRDYVEPPLDLSRYPSPLTALRRYLMTQTDRERLLFTVSGLPANTPIRLAVMDNWDGTSMGVAGTSATESSGQFRRVGSTVPTRLRGDVARVQIKIEGYNDYWVPSVGGTSGVSFAGPRTQALKGGYYYNPASDSALVTSGLVSGDMITLDAVVPLEVADPQSLGTAPAGLPELAKAPDSVVEMASTLVGEGGRPYERATQVTKALRDQGFYTPHGTDEDRPPGHGYVRLSDFAASDQWVGDEEQYGAIATLLARQVAVPARLVMGFRNSTGQISTKQTSTEQNSQEPLAIRGRDVDVWLEVALAGAGWVALHDLTPPRDRLPAKSEKPAPKPRPEVQVPPAPQSESQEETTSQDVPEKDKPREDPAKRSIPQWLVFGAAGISIPLLLLMLYALIVVGLKRRRRKARRGHPNPSVAVAGGWQELLDQAIDNGLAAPATTATRTEASQQLSQQLPDSLDTGAQLDLLARQADAAVFAPIPPTPDQVRSYWDDVATAGTFVSVRKGAAGRWRARLSPSSLRSSRTSVTGGSRRRRGPLAGRRRSG